MQPSSSRVVVTVIGHDKVGIIAGVSSLLADAGVNIIDISQTTMREFFTMIMLVDVEKAIVAFDEIKRRLQQKGEQMGLKIDAQREDVFQYMHRI
jgi:ACT domain-containing protein